MTDKERLGYVNELMKNWEEPVQFLTQSKCEGMFSIHDYLNDTDFRELMEECLSASSDNIEN